MGITYPYKRKKLSKGQREEIYNKYNGHCAYCGCELDIKDMQVDHIMPMMFYEAYIADGKDIDDMWNYNPACRSCNHYKSTLTLNKFREQIYQMNDVLMRDSVTYKNAVRFGQVIPNKHPVEFYFEKYNNLKENK